MKCHRVRLTGTPRGDSVASFVSRRGDFGSPARRFWTELFTFVTTAVGAPSPLSGKLPTHPGVTCLGRGCDKYSTPLILSGPVSGGGDAIVQMWIQMQTGAAAPKVKSLASRRVASFVSELAHQSISLWTWGFSPTFQTLCYLLGTRSAFKSANVVVPPLLLSFFFFFVRVRASQSLSP